MEFTKFSLESAVISIICMWPKFKSNIYIVRRRCFIFMHGKCSVTLSRNFAVNKLQLKLRKYSLRIGFRSRFGQGLGQTLGI